MLRDLDTVFTLEIQAELIWLFLCGWAKALGKLRILHDDQGFHDQIAGVNPVRLEKCQRLVMAFFARGFVLDVFKVPDTARSQQGYAWQPTIGILDGHDRVHST